MNRAEAGRLGGLKARTKNAERRKQRIDFYYKNPKLCKQCGLPIEYIKRVNDFCNNSCAAKHSNPISKRKYRTSSCLHCDTKLGRHKYKFCSIKCGKDYDWVKKREQIKNGSNDNVAVHTLKKYLFEIYGTKCQICNITEWCNKPVPLVLDHISGNPYNNHIENLRLICHNCNAQTPTFAGKNKGNGRFERAKRYKLERETFKQMLI